MAIEHGKQVYAKEIRDHIEYNRLCSAKEMLKRYSGFFFKTEIQKLTEEIIEKSLKEKIPYTAMLTLEEFKQYFRTKKEIRILAGKILVAAIEAKEKNVAGWILEKNIDVFNKTQIKYFDNKIGDI